MSEENSMISDLHNELFGVQSEAKLRLDLALSEIMRRDLISDLQMERARAEKAENDLAHIRKLHANQRNTIRKMQEEARRQDTKKPDWIREYMEYASTQEED